VRSSVGLTFTPSRYFTTGVSSLAGRFAYKHNKVLAAPSWGVGRSRSYPPKASGPLSYLRGASLADSVHRGTPPPILRWLHRHLFLVHPIPISACLLVFSPYAPTLQEVGAMYNCSCN
jgi:hypothetical protein